MAPKRARGGSKGASSSSVAPTFDRAKFVSDRAAERYLSALTKRSIIGERGFDMNFDACYQFIRDDIESMDWVVFCAHPESAVAALVREFYANAIETVELGFSVVRGKKIYFDPVSIRTALCLDENPPEICHFTELKNNQDLETVTSTICHDEIEIKWTKSASGEPRHFHQRCLIPHANVWLHFVCARILPTTHKSDVYKEQAFLIYCIMEGKSVDVAQIIHDHIRDIVKNDTHLGHPSLIQVLCRFAGVQWLPTEELANNLGAINDTAIQRMLREPRTEPTEPPPPRRSQTQIDAEWRTLTDRRFSSLANRMVQHEERMEQRFDQLEQRIDANAQQTQASLDEILSAIQRLSHGAQD